MFRQVKPALWKAPLGALFCVGIFGARTLPFGVICAGMGPDAVAVLQAIIGVPLLFIRLEEWVTGLPLTIGDPACWRPSERQKQGSQLLSKTDEKSMLYVPE